MIDSPSGRLTQTTGVVGLRTIDSSVGAPQMGVQIPSWIRSPGWM